MSKTTTKDKGTNYKSSIIGVGMLLAVASITYSTAVIVMGTDGLTPKVMVAPQALLALVVAVKQFIKQGDK